MKLIDAHRYYVRHSTRASELARQFGFAALALIWLLKPPDGDEFIPHALRWPTLLVVTALACDLLQYVAATTMWGGFHRTMERLGTPRDAEFKAPRWINWPALFFFWIKLALIAATEPLRVLRRAL